MATSVELLRRHMAGIVAGAIAADVAPTIEDLLSQCWDEIDGSDRGGMSGSKICGRTEAMRWAPSVLTFDIERHGGAANGSIYAEIQTWSIDLSICSARCSGGRKRLVGHRDGPLKIAPIAEDVAAAIIAGRRDDPRLQWLSSGRVRLQVGAIIPRTNAQTTGNRRRKFAGAIDAALAKHGWRRVAKMLNTFEKYEEAP
jgi:hypothetical protein